MDIEQTKKLNFMIKELNRTGCVSSYDDAMAVAGNIYDGGLPKSTEIENGERMREMVDMRIQHHLSQNQEELGAKLAKVTEANDSLKQELKQLWQAIESLKQAPRFEKPQEIESTPEVRPAVQQSFVDTPKAFVPREQPVQQERPIIQNSPRCGSYNSNDVALDKFFYCGNKR